MLFKKISRVDRLHEQRVKESDETIIPTMMCVCVFFGVTCTRQQSSIEDQMTGQYKSRYPVQHFGVPVDAH